MSFMPWSPWSLYRFLALSRFLSLAQWWFHLFYFVIIAEVAEILWWSGCAQLSCMGWVEKQPTKHQAIGKLKDIFNILKQLLNSKLGQKTRHKTLQCRKSLVKGLGLENPIKKWLLEENKVLLPCCHPQKYWHHPVCVKSSPQCCNYCGSDKNILISVICVSSGAILWTFKGQDQCGSIRICFHLYFIIDLSAGLIDVSHRFCQAFQSTAPKNMRNFGSMLQFCWGIFGFEVLVLVFGFGFCDSF